MVVRKFPSGSVSEVSRSALELYENRIDFGKGKEPTRIPLDLDDSDDENADTPAPPTAIDTVPTYPQEEKVPTLKLTTHGEITRSIPWDNHELGKDFQLDPPNAEPRGLLDEETENKGLEVTTEAYAAFMELDRSIREKTDGGTQGQVGVDQTADNTTHNDTDSSESSLKTLVQQEQQNTQARIAKKEVEIRTRLLGRASRGVAERASPPAAPEADQSAFTHIITTIGSNPDTTRQTANLRSRKRLRHREWYKPRQATKIEHSGNFNQKIRSITQKDEPQAATLEPGTISVRAVEHTRERSKRLSARAWVKEDISLTSTFTSQPRTAQEDIWLNEAMRDEAARLAVVASLEKAKDAKDASRIRSIRQPWQLHKPMASHQDSQAETQYMTQDDSPGGQTEQKEDAVIEGPLPTSNEPAEAQDEAIPTLEVEGQNMADEVRTAHGDGQSREEVVPEALDEFASSNEGQNDDIANAQAEEQMDEVQVPAPSPKPRSRPIYLVKKMLQLVLTLIEWYFELIQPCFELDSD